MYQPSPQYQGQPPAQPDRRGCIGRNWKWMLPVGCLGLIIAVVAVGAGIFVLVTGVIKSSDVYQQALQRARSNPEVIRELGEPIEPGLFVSGSIQDSSVPGEARAALSIPISGPRGSGTIQAVATKNARGSWEFSLLSVAINGRDQSINLLRSNSSSAEPGGDDIQLPINLPTMQPSPGTSGGGGRTISGGVLNGRAISKPEPAYPAIARAARAQGTVNVQVLVDEEGNVIQAVPVSGHPLLQLSATQAARQARFEPTLDAGQPVKVSGTLTYNFVLDQ